MNWRSWSRLRLGVVLSGLALVLGSVALGAADLGWARHQESGRVTAPAPTAGISSAPTPFSLTTSRPGSVPPQRIAIPSIGVDAAIEQVGVDGNSQMGVPGKAVDVGWYSLGSSPGQPGDAVMDGHLDTPTGAPAVFARLAQLRPGADIRVTMSDSRVIVFRVSHTSEVPYQSRPAGLYAIEGPPRLTLITCTGSWDSNRHVYTQRLVVDAVPVGPEG